jgi:O-antigen/teichoic acid export membrane protein
VSFLNVLKFLSKKNVFNNKVNKIVKLLHNTDGRTGRVQKNIILSFVIRGIGILVSFLLVPLTINYLDATNYGIWLTLSSILMWINYFDIGLGNGLRNKLAVALAQNEQIKAREYVSTAFILLTVIVFVFFVIFYIANFSLQWDKILNVAPEQREMLGKLVIVVFAFFCLQFVFKTIGTVLVADQRPAFNDLLTVSGTCLSFIITYILTQTVTGNLVYVAVTFSAAPVVVLIIACFALFFGKYRFLCPSLRFVRIKHIKELIGLGLQFFIIQLTVSILIYSSTNIILAQLFGSETVTQYNIAFKYFNVLTLVFVIVITPFWSAATDAYEKNELQWIRSSIKKLLIIFGIFMVAIVLMLAFSNIFYKIWVGDSIAVPLTLSVAVAIYTAIFIWSNIFIYFINGIGKIRLQLYVTLVIAVLHIPLAVYLGKLWGVNGVVLATTVSQIPVSILMPLQCWKICFIKAKGIWNK